MKYLDWLGRFNGLRSTVIQNWIVSTSHPPEYGQEQPSLIGAGCGSHAWSKWERVISIGRILVLMNCGQNASFEISLPLLACSGSSQGSGRLSSRSYSSALLKHDSIISDPIYEFVWRSLASDARLLGNVPSRPRVAVCFVAKSWCCCWTIRAQGLIWWLKCAPPSKDRCLSQSQCCLLSEGKKEGRERERVRGRWTVGGPTLYNILRHSTT